jgi:hypothetical protein
LALSISATSWLLRSLARCSMSSRFSVVNLPEPVAVPADARERCVEMILIGGYGISVDKTSLGKGGGRWDVARVGASDAGAHTPGSCDGSLRTGAASILSDKCEVAGVGPSSEDGTCRLTSGNCSTSSTLIEGCSASNGFQV